MIYILEEVYGNQAIVCHRTKSLNNIENISKSGFKAGHGAMYGTGIYFTYDLDSQLNSFMHNQYGNYLIKSRLYLDKFLIFDYEVAKKVYGKKYTLMGQFKELKIPIQDDSKIIMYSNKLHSKEGLVGSSYIAQKIYSNYYDNLKNYVNGIMYYGKHDGRAGVVYNENLIHPISYTLNESKGDKLEWIKMDEQHEYYTKDVKNIQLGLEKEKEREYDENGNRVAENNLGNIGLVDKNKKIIIPIEYKEMALLSNGNYKVKDKNDLYGIYNKNGNIIIPVKYKKLASLDNGKYKVQDENDLYGIIDKEENEIIPVKYKDIYLLKNGKYQVQYENDLWGIIDEYGNTIINFEYKYINLLDNGKKYEVMDKNNLYGIYNKEGNIIIPIEYKEMALLSNGNYKVIDKNHFYGIYNKEGNIIIPVEYKYINILSNGNYEVTDKNNLHGIIDKNGKVLVPLKYQWIYLLSNGNYKAIDRNNNFIYFDKEGKQIEK